MRMNIFTVHGTYLTGFNYIFVISSHSYSSLHSNKRIYIYSSSYSSISI